MREICLSLILSAFPEEVDAEEVLRRNQISLSHMEISKIDCLELFDNLLTLDLSYNCITTIDNISFLHTLTSLNVACNLIREVHPDQFPPSLISIDLSGNPCVVSRINFDRLIEQFDALTIITSTVKEELPQEDEEDREGLEPFNAENTYDTMSMGVMDSDQLLVSITDRKCRIQSLLTSPPTQSTPISQLTALQMEASAATGVLMAKFKVASASAKYDLEQHNASYSSQLEELKKYRNSL